MFTTHTFSHTETVDIESIFDLCSNELTPEQAMSVYEYLAANTVEDSALTLDVFTNLYYGA